MLLTLSSLALGNEVSVAPVEGCQPTQGLQGCWPRSYVGKLDYSWGMKASQTFAVIDNHVFAMV